MLGWPSAAYRFLVSFLLPSANYSYLLVFFCNPGSHALLNSGKECESRLSCLVGKFNRILPKHFWPVPQRKMATQKTMGLCGVMFLVLAMRCTAGGLTQFHYRSFGLNYAIQGNTRAQRKACKRSKPGVEQAPRIRMDEAKQERSFSQFQLPTASFCPLLEKAPTVRLMLVTSLTGPLPHRQISFHVDASPESPPTAGRALVRLAAVNIIVHSHKLSTRLPHSSHTRQLKLT